MMMLRLGERQNASTLFKEHQMPNKAKLKLDPEYVAKLLLINLDLYSDEKEKDYSRFRLSKTNLRLMAARAKLYQTFLEELSSELLGLGWQMFEAGDSEFAFIREDKMTTWPKIGRQRVIDPDGSLRYGSVAEIQVAFEKIPSQHGDPEQD